MQPEVREMVEIAEYVDVDRLRARIADLDAAIAPLVAERRELSAVLAMVCPPAQGTHPRPRVSRADAIIDAMTGQAPMTLRQVMDAMAAGGNAVNSEYTLRQSLTRMAQAGQVRRPSRGLWEIVRSAGPE